MDEDDGAVLPPAPDVGGWLEAAGTIADRQHRDTSQQIRALCLSIITDGGWWW